MRERLLEARNGFADEGSRPLALFYQPVADQFLDRLADGDAGRIGDIRQFALGRQGRIRRKQTGGDSFLESPSQLDVSGPAAFGQDAG